MKAYLMFSGLDYYPGGGIADYDGDFDSIDEAVKHFEDMRHDWYQIVQSNDMSIVCEFPC